MTYTICYAIIFAKFVKKPKKALKCGVSKSQKALEGFKMIYPEYDEEIVSKSTATINGRGGVSVRVRTCVAI